MIQLKNSETVPFGFSLRLSCTHFRTRTLLERSLAALEVLKQPKTRGRGRAAPPKSLAELGPHPDSGKAVSLKSGRYGPYVTDGELNASLPRGADPAQVTMAQAVELLNARANKIASGEVKKPRGGGAGGRKKKAAAKK